MNRLCNDHDQYSDIEWRLQKLQRRLRRARVSAVATKQREQLRPGALRALRRRTTIHSSSTIGKILLWLSSDNNGTRLFLSRSLHPAQNASCSTSDSDHFSRGFAEEPPNVTLSLNDTPQQSTEQIPPSPAPATVGMTTVARPQHIWSQSTRVQRPWLAFSGDDPQSSASSSGYIPKLNTPPHDFSSQQNFNTVDLTQLHEIDAYLLAYGSLSHEELG